ncbi:hypothetical protein [Litoreibacter janthinus]|uniref:Uncharacterized protein n=1 Tax=Litoreibacter janthinus TaxID=670154 RepID=A0A1I6GZH0_9RHOB|nr:hypothetical protein [Litoreibacter janthinus]SFR47578.1 hypothetical protein SAMN04488002_2204 [Litoreibacter janthinus]
MSFETLDSTKLIILMIAGAVFAGVGLYLLLRPKPEGAAKIELFGLKFESSSAGLLVFLVGAAFMSLPLFVKEKIEPNVPIAVVPNAPSSPRAPSNQPAETQPANPIVIADGAMIEEVEPNDGAFEANALALGQRAKGTVIKDKPDWFVILVPDGGIVGDQVMLKHVRGYEVRLELYNAREEHKGWIKTSEGAKYLEIKSDFEDRIYLKVHSVYPVNTSDYEVAVVPSD